MPAPKTAKDILATELKEIHSAERQFSRADPGDVFAEFEGRTPAARRARGRKHLATQHPQVVSSAA